MACITIVTGQGGDCNNGGPLPNLGEFRFDGKWYPTSHVTLPAPCSGRFTWTTLIDGNGNIIANFFREGSPVISEGLAGGESRSSPQLAGDDCCST
jgi:hypothetical protein